MASLPPPSRRSAVRRRLRSALVVSAAACLCGGMGSHAFLGPQLPTGGGADGGGLLAGGRGVALRKPLRESGIPTWHTAAASAAQGTKGSTKSTAMSINLAKNLVGSGILSLPAGIAAFASSAGGVGPALAMLVAAAAISAYAFYLIGRVCERTKTGTFGGAWKESLKVGSWVPLAICILECLGGSTVYAMVLGDVFSAMIPVPRSTLIIGIAATVLFPLCCLRSFGALAKFSLLGNAASSYVVLFVVKRFFDGSYAPGGAFYTKAAAATLTGVVHFDSRMLILVSILSTAFLVHFNAPQMYEELEGKGASKERSFGLVALVGFGIAMIQYALVMVFGFLTFGSATQGNILLNYSQKDPLALAASVAIGISMLFGYPMQFAGFRSGILEAFGSGELPKVKHRLVTAGLLASVVAVACAFRDLGKFQAIEGAALAAFLIYIAPPMMAFKLWKGNTARAGYVSLIILGIFLAIVGCKVTMM